MKATTVLGAALAATLSLGVALHAQAGEVTVHGSTTVASNIMLPHKSDIEKQSGQSLKVVANGSSRGVLDLAAGSANMATISAPLETTLKKINKKKPGATAGMNLIAHRVGTTRVAFVVHPSNPVKSLTLAQIAGLMSGKIKNWKDLGGKDAPILVVMVDTGRSIVQPLILVTNGQPSTEMAKVIEAARKFGG